MDKNLVLIAAILANEWRRKNLNNTEMAWAIYDYLWPLGGIIYIKDLACITMMTSTELDALIRRMTEELEPDKLIVTEPKPMIVTESATVNPVPVWLTSLLVAIKSAARMKIILTGFRTRFGKAV